MLTGRVANSPEIVEKPILNFDLAIVVPTLNECDNVPELVSRLKTSLHGLEWELIVVDDDSMDGTSEVVRRLSFDDHRIKLIHRLGRRGLASACIEGMLATCCPMIAVMDADLQHDESVLPLMLKKVREEDLDLVLGTRHADGGSMGSCSARRALISRFGRCISRTIDCCNLSDPMSGFFVVRRDFFLDVVPRLRGDGFKILLDIVASSVRPVRIGEVGYQFRDRRFGASKLDLRVAFKYVAMVVSKLGQRRLDPHRTS